MTPGARSALRFLCFSIAGSVCLLAAGQSAPVGGQAVFKSSIDLVHLDVSVLDRTRVPVRGLTAADFTILEDGVARPISAFAELLTKAPVKASERTSVVDKASADVQTNEIARTPEGRLFVVILDDAMIPADPQMAATAKKIAETAIDRLSPGDQMAVVYTVNSKGAQNFTGDRAKLLKAISTFKPGYATHLLGWDNAVWNEEKRTYERVADPDDGLRAGSLRTLEMVAESLIAAPQRRKAIIWVSTGMFVDPLGASSIVKVGAGMSMMIREGNRSLAGRLPALFRHMREANVTIYSVDPGGLGGLENFVQTKAAGTHAIISSTRNMSLMDDWFDPANPPRAMDLSHKVASVNLDFLKTVAENTGGVAITDTNDLTGGIERIFAENDAYYLLGFTVPPGHRAGSLHRLEVKVNRPGVTVRARSGYEVAEAPKAPDAAPGAKPVPSAAAVILAGPVPAGALPMRVAVAPLGLAAADKSDAVVALALGLEHRVTEATSQTLELELRAVTTEGRFALGERRTAQATLRPATARLDDAFDLLARIVLPPGRYELRFGATLSPANLAGSLFADVEVPDFKRDPLSVSGVLMETNGGNAGPLDAFADLTKVIPTSSRVFTRRDSPQAFVRIYQGGDGALARASIRVTLRDRADELIFNNRFPLPADRFDAATRATDFKFMLPTVAMKAGAYLLTFEAELGTHTVQRQVKFTYR
jgi:VWFA-related protein